MCVINRDRREVPYICAPLVLRSQRLWGGLAVWRLYKQTNKFERGTARTVGAGSKGSAAPNPRKGQILADSSELIFYRLCRCYGADPPLLVLVLFLICYMEWCQVKSFGGPQAPLRRGSSTGDMETCPGRRGRIGRRMSQNLNHSRE